MAVVFPAHAEDWVMEVIAGKPRTARLGALRQESEALLVELQEAGGMDRLWRWYFRLAGRIG